MNKKMQKFFVIVMLVAILATSLLAGIAAFL
jgi:Na+-translocating ferredoxin:NAD+ oxidoreductase RnfG subunit